VSLTLRDGRVLFRVGYGGETRLEMASQDRHNTGNWTIVEASRLFDRRKKLEKGLLINHYLAARSVSAQYSPFVTYFSQEIQSMTGCCYNTFVYIDTESY
jgi:hypothetical protein